MNEILAQLHDIHQPDPISVWPLAMGWWLLLLLLLLTIAAGIGYYLYWRKHKRYRKLALKQLEQLYQQYQGQPFLFALASLLKRTALHRHPETAQMNGAQWQHFLQQHMSESDAHLLAVARYQSTINFDQAALYQAAKHWIKAHQ